MDFEKWGKIAEKIPEYRRGGTAGMALVVELWTKQVLLLTNCHDLSFRDFEQVVRRDPKYGIRGPCCRPNFLIHH
jgi:hypothetical protein